MKSISGYYALVALFTICLRPLYASKTYSVHFTNTHILIFMILAILYVYTHYRMIKRRKKDLILTEIIENSEYALVSFDLEGNVNSINNKARRIFHVSDNQVLPCKFSSIFPHGRDHDFYSKVTEYIKNGGDGRLVPFIFNSIFVDPQTENTVSYLASIRLHEVKSAGANLYILALLENRPEDVIDLNLKKSLFKAEKNIEELKNIDRLKSEFLAMCSHELKTPLVSIRGYLDLMSSGKLGDLSEQQRKALKITLRNSEELNNLISSMLNFARMEAGKLDFYFSKSDSNRMIEEAIEAVKPIADKNEVVMEFEPLTTSVPVLADYGLIYRVLLNLITNAIKFSIKGSKIKLSAKVVDSESVLFSISDNGCGISKDDIGKIKKPFVQAKKDTQPRKGLGLGLAISERILIGHESTLVIESVEGKGTTVSFTLKMYETEK